MPDKSHRETLERLLVFLEQDPANPSLLRDVAQAALAAGEAGRAADMMARLEQAGALTAEDSNLAAIALMRSGDAPRAARIFERLLDDAPGDPGLRFNLAWARTLAKDPDNALGLLDAATTAALPQAAMLEVQLLHDAGAFEDAADRARLHLAAHGAYPPLLAAVSVLALDLEDEELARQCAEGAGAHPDALTTLGTLHLAEQGPEAARPLFEQALAGNPRSPRAWIGLGLAKLASGDHGAAGEALDTGGELFGDHLGSWIASGWAYLLGGDHALARERFGHALRLDPNFAESHGSLAVLDMLEGNRAGAQIHLDRALGLDRQCFSAAFAKVLMASDAADPDAARRIMEIALKQPLDGRERTIAEAIARLAR